MATILHNGVLSPHSTETDIGPVAWNWPWWKRICTMEIGQRYKFRPPPLLFLESCLSKIYQHTTGLTFVNLPQFKFRP